MTLSMTPIIAELTAEEFVIVTRPVVARRGGGMQGLLRKLLQRLNRDTRRINMTAVDLIRVQRYARYCPGGYEDRFLAIEAAAQRAQDRSSSALTGLPPQDLAD
jgi:hypothetical protein